MGDVYDLAGKKLTGNEPVRTSPVVNIDTEEGHFAVPVVYLAQGQIAEIAALSADLVLEHVLPLLYEQLELPLEV